MGRLNGCSESVSASPTATIFLSGARCGPSAPGGGGTFGAGSSSKDDLKKLVAVSRGLLMVVGVSMLVCQAQLGLLSMLEVKITILVD